MEGLTARPKRGVDVLVIDDDLDMIELLRGILEHHKMSVATLSHSERFDQAIKEYQPRVVITDMIMPDRDGIEIVRWISEQSMPIGVIICSGSNPTYMDSAQAIGESGGLTQIRLLSKPFSQSKVIKEVSALLRQETRCAPSLSFGGILSL